MRLSRFFLSLFLSEVASLLCGRGTDGPGTKKNKNKNKSGGLTENTAKSETLELVQVWTNWERGRPGRPHAAGLVVGKQEMCQA